MSNIFSGHGHELETEIPVEGNRIHWTLKNGAIIRISESPEGLRIEADGRIQIIGIASNCVHINDLDHIELKRRKK